MPRLSAHLALIGLLLGALSCSKTSSRPETAILARAGVPDVALSCKDIRVVAPQYSVGGRLSVCHASLDSTGVATLVERLGLGAVPDSAWADLNTLDAAAAVPGPCGSALHAALTSRAAIRGVFGQPPVLFEPSEALQYEHLIVVPLEGYAACFFFELAYG